MGIRHGVTGGTRPRRAHWCRFTLIRPSIGGWVLIPVAVAVWYMALLLDERTLVAAALTLTAAWGLDLVMTVVQGVLIATSSLPPTHPTTTVQIERLNADGHRLERYVG